MPSHTGRLVLTPVDATAAVDRDALIDRLTSGGLIGPGLPGMADAFSAGDALLELIAFAGCAVTLAVEPGADPGADPGAAFCHVRIPPLARWPRPVFGRNTRGPRCPSCRARLADWRDALDQWDEPRAPALGCPGCGASAAPWQWDWKQQGGFGRCLVLVEEVFPGEAVPAPRLLDLLSAVSGSDWRYFYVQD